MLAWMRGEASLASRTKDLTKSASSARCGSRRFKATMRSKPSMPRFFARCTVAIPPRPSRSKMTYGPNSSVTRVPSTVFAIDLTDFTRSDATRVNPDGESGANQDGGFVRSQLGEARVDRAARHLAGDIQVELAVALFGGAEIGVERAQGGVGPDLGQEPQPFVAAGLDQGAAEHGVDRPLGPGEQRGRVAGAGLVAEGDAAAADLGQDLLEMDQLLAGQAAHPLGQARPIGELPHVANGRVGRLLLAVGVVDQHRLGIGDGRRRPSGGARRERNPAHGTRTSLGSRRTVPPRWQGTVCSQAW